MLFTTRLSSTTPTPPRLPPVCSLVLPSSALTVLTPASRPTPAPPPAATLTTTTGRHDTRQQQTFIPLSREREVSRARARRALAGGWAVPREIVSLAPPPPPTPTPCHPAVPKGDNIVTDPSALGGFDIAAAAGGFSHTVLVTGDGRMYVFGEGAAVAGGDLATLEGKGASVDGGRLREAGGLVRGRQLGEEVGGERPDPVAVSGGAQRARRGVRAIFTVDVAVAAG